MRIISACLEDISLKSTSSLVQVKAAFEAVTKLHGTALAGKKQAAQEKLWARQLKGEGAMVKKWRLILRNLSFNVSAFCVP